MRWSRLIFVPLLALHAEEVPDAATLLQRSAQALDQYLTYQFEFNASMVTVRPGGASWRFQVSGLVSGTNSGKFHIESPSPGGYGKSLIDDRQTIWIYDRASNSFTTEGDVRAGLFGMLARVGVPGTPAIVTETVGAPREETISIDGELHVCWVIETIPPPPWMQKVTTWIDKRTLVAWQVVTDNRYSNLPDLTTTIRRSKLRLNPVLPDSLFIFTPAPGAEHRANPPGVH